MSFDAILSEVEQLHGVGTRLERSAKQHVPVTEQLLTIAEMYTAPRRCWQYWWRQSCERATGINNSAGIDSQRDSLVGPRYLKS
jgi:hypothetical protein